MADLLFHPIVPLEPQQLERGVWLLVLKPGKIPPHLALVVNGAWFSHTVRGGEIALPVANRVELLMKRKIAALCMAINTDGVVKAEGIFRRSVSLADGATCLDPVAEVLALHTTANCRNAQSLHELVPMLLASDCLGITGSLNMGNAESCTIAAYNRADILRAIQDLRQPNIV